VTRQPVGPPAITPLVAATLPGEGVWKPAGEAVGGRTAIYVTSVRPDTEHIGVFTAVARMDHSLLRGQLIPGRYEPGNGPWIAGSAVPTGERADLLAAFNSGFRLKDARGGFYAEGRTVGRMVNGAATLVVSRDGTVNVGQWGRDVTMNPDVVAARQNLSLIVDASRLVPGLDENTANRWGATAGNRLFVWRSGLGVDPAGNLIYAASDGLSVRTLADVLRRAGAVRAMELDINHPWVSYNLYSHDAGTVSGQKLLASMSKPGSRYLTADDRDFVALLARRPA
jgi:hypothetical protein